MALALLAAIILAHEQPARTATPSELGFFKNYFVTGNYIVGGVDLPPNSGTVTGTIPMSGVPDNSDILAAYLYLQTTNTQANSSGLATGTLFRGHDVSAIAKQVGSLSVDPATTQCWSSSGGSSSFTVRSFRVDVLRFLPLGTDDTKKNYRKLLVNDLDLANHGEAPHTITLPAKGTGSQVSSRGGASLVVVYRHPDEPLTGIVMFDGLDVLTGNENLQLDLKYFYEPSHANPIARLTHIVSSSGQSSTDSILLDGKLVSSDPFQVSPSTPSDRGWHTTFDDVSSQMPATPFPAGNASITTEISASSQCVASTAAIFSTTLQDTDQDGNLDSWESDRSLLGPILDPDGQPLPNLYAMGARPNVQDIFVEVGFLRTSGYGVGGKGQGVVPAHDHLPSKVALDTVATAFRNAAPRSGVAGPINIHFDVGNNYQAGLPTQAECNASWTPGCAIIPFKHADLVTDCAPAPDAYGHTPDIDCLARGGEAIEETFECVTDSTGMVDPYDCQFPDYVALGWKNGYRFFRDQPLSYTLPPFTTVASDEEGCTLATDCQRRFDRTRKDIFRYALFAHAMGLSRLDDPATPSVDESRTPRNVSGMADGGAGGGDLTVTLGLWDDFKGTDSMVASTFMHELGHTMGLRHGGQPDFSGVNPKYEPNCKPNFQSVMNYVYQVRLLIPLASQPGQGGGSPVIDYSRQEIPAGSPGTLDEGSLDEAGMGSTLYTARWYVASNGFLDPLGTTIFASRYCNGNPLNGAPPMIALDATTTRIDWSGDGDTADTGVAQDINFSGGPPDTLNRGSNDWFNLDLRQVGARRNPGSVRIAGAFSLDIQFDDLGFGDSGFGDSGFGDSGFGDSGFGDSGFGDSGFGDSGFGDSGFGDSGFGDSGFGDSGSQGDLDFETARALGAAPNGLTATIINNRGDVRLTWVAPPAFQENAAAQVSPVDFYEIYRVEGDMLTPLNIGARVLVGGVPVDAPATTVVDPRVQNNRTYTYFGLAQYENGHRSGVSNFATISR